MTNSESCWMQVLVTGKISQAVVVAAAAYRDSAGFRARTGLTNSQLIDDEFHTNTHVSVSSVKVCHVCCKGLKRCSVIAMTMWPFSLLQLAVAPVVLVLGDDCEKCVLLVLVYIAHNEHAMASLTLCYVRYANMLFSLAEVLRSLI